MTPTRTESLPVFDYGTCTACTSCVEVCPVSCLVLDAAIEPKDAHAYPSLGQTGAAACIGCSFCVWDCPVDAIEMTGGTPDADA